MVKKSVSFVGNKNEIPRRVLLRFSATFCKQEAGKKLHERKILKTKKVVKINKISSDHREYASQPSTSGEKNGTNVILI